MSRAEVCVIFGGGDAVSADTVKSELSGGELLIAADSGYILMEKLGLAAELIIGDFDSAPEPVCDNKAVYPVRKDDTDLMLAVKAGLTRGCKRFIIFGATGGRLDHTFAAVQTLAYILDNGAYGSVVSDDVRIELLDPGRYEFPKREGFTLSLFAYSPKVTGLDIRGAEYSGSDLELCSGFPLGVSNAVSESVAGLYFKTGRLLVICSKL